MHPKYLNHCRICGNSHLVPVIDLGEQYLQGSFVKPGHVMPPQRKLPTKLVRCDVTQDDRACGLLQLAHTFPPEVLYANYWYRSGTNQTMRDHLRGLVESALAFTPGKRKKPLTTLDIGCNDGTLLSFYPDEFERFGVDPSDIAREIGPPVTVVNTVFPSKRATAAFGERKFDVITSIAMYYDLDAPVEFARGVAEILAQDGLWILEMSYLPLMLAQNSFDTICHEHLEYYSLAVLEHIFSNVGLRVFKAELNDINGGSIRCYVCHDGNNRFDSQETADHLRKLRLREFELELDTDRPYRKFQQRIERLRNDTLALLQKLRMEDQRIHIYGASTKGNVILQWYGIDRMIVEVAADRNPEKTGAKTLGTNISIVDEETSRGMQPNYYLVLPWHFKREFLQRERELIAAGTRMIFPLPELSVVDADNIDAELARLDQDCGSLDLVFDRGVPELN